MLYLWYEMSRAALKPARMAADSYKHILNNPFNPLFHTPIGKSTAAAFEVFERTTRRYAKPEFDIKSIKVNGNKVKITEEIIWKKSFCQLLHFKKEAGKKNIKDKSRLLIVAPMSGHYATLLRGTVEDLLPHHDIYITDWQDARNVPLYKGGFDLNSYIAYLIEMLELFDGDVHVLAVCQPAVPVLAAVSLMEAVKNPCVPYSMTMMGGPIDTRINQTAVNLLAEEKGIAWFEKNVITHVPWPNTGVGRNVYPGFLQLSGFMTMNLDRHVTAHKDLFWHLVEGDGDSADKHRSFYDEYLAVMDLTAEFYLQTVDNVFIRHSLPNGRMKCGTSPIEPGAIERVALLTIEGEKDDISGLGQTEAAHALCKNLPQNLKKHYVQPGVGHYGIFNGSRYREEIVPMMTKFIYENQGDKKASIYKWRPIEPIKIPK